MDEATKLAILSLVARWAVGMVHANALPAVLLGVSYDANGRPDLHIAYGEGMDVEQVKLLLGDVLALLRKGHVLEAYRGNDEEVPPGHPTRGRN